MKLVFVYFVIYELNISGRSSPVDYVKTTLLDQTHEQVVHGSIEWIGLSKVQLYSKSLFFELDEWNFGSSIVLVSF